MQELLPLLEAVVQSGKPLLIVAEDVEGARLLPPWSSISYAAASRLLPLRRRASAIAASAMLQDIAVLTGGQAISEDLGIKLENVTIQMLGRTKKVMIDKENTTIVNGA